jgi:hypothetical protein
VADHAGVTVDTTTYANPVAGSGNLTTLVFPQDTAALAIALTGDAHPRWLMTTDGLDGIYMGNGASDLYNVPSASMNVGSNNEGVLSGNGMSLKVGSAASGGRPKRAFVGGSLQISPNGSTITSGAGIPAISGELGDIYIRTDGSPYLYFCTTAGVAGVAVWSTYTHAAPADASLSAGDLALWFDQTNGAAKLMVKGKSANGTVVTAAVALS